MSQISTVMAKLSGIRKSLVSALEENINRAPGAVEIRKRQTFSDYDVGHYFQQAAKLTDDLRIGLPALYADFQELSVKPLTEMSDTNEDGDPIYHFNRSQVERLIRDIEQILEIRANSELMQPNKEPNRRVFISHGRSKDWHEVQSFIEKEVKLDSLELAQEPSGGRTIIEKLIESADYCDSAVIVMT